MNRCERVIMNKEEGDRGSLFPLAAARLRYIRVNATGEIRKVSVFQGRNGPCPCGSGKKYKKCCKHRDDSRGKR